MVLAFVLILALFVIVLWQLSTIRRHLSSIEVDQVTIRELVTRLLRPPTAETPSEARPTPAPEPSRTPIAPAPTPRPAPPPVPHPTLIAPAPRPIQRTAPPPPAEETPDAQAAGVLSRIWRWILVGDEDRKPGISFEYAVASTWLLRAGIVAIVACIAFFLKWSIDRNLIGPTARVLMGAGTGIALLAWGRMLLGKRYHLIGQGFLGGGLAALYFSAYAAGPMYELVSTSVTFAAMCLITIGAGLLAARTHSLLVALLGTVGGFCTPVVLSTGRSDFAILYPYILLLCGGILVLSHLRGWRLLNYIGFLFTWLLVLASLTDYTRADYPVVMPLLAAIFLLHALVVVGGQLRPRRASTVLELLMLISNALFFGAIAYTFTRDAHGLTWPAAATGALVVLFAVLAATSLRLPHRDARIVSALMALSALFAALTLPILFHQRILTAGWALLAAALLWLAARVRSPLLRAMSHLLYLIVAIKLLLADLLYGIGLDLPANATWTLYAHSLWPRLWTMGLCLASLFAAVRFERRWKREDSPMPAAFHWCGLVLLFIFLQLEVNQLFALMPSFHMTALSLLWFGMGAYLLVFGAAGRPALGPAIVFTVCGLVKLALWDLAAWGIWDDFLYDGPLRFALLLSRSIDFAGAIAICIFLWQALRARQADPAPAAAFGYAALALLFLYATLEVNTALHLFAPVFQAGGLSILWAVFAVSFVAIGLGKRITLLRRIGLVLFAVVVFKAFLIDLSRVEIVVRVFAFLGLGIALLLGAFAYLRAAPTDKSADPPDAI